MLTSLRRCTFALTLTAAALQALAGTAGPVAVFDTATAAEKAAAPASGVTYAVINGEKTEVPDIPMGDPETVRRIIDEGKNRNRVMEHLAHLTKELGPRLTGSANLEASNVWTREQFEAWGLKNAQLWKWGEIPVRFDRGPSAGKIVMVRNPNAEAPEYRTLRELEFTTLSWSAGTDGPVRGPVVKMPENEEQFEAVKDVLPGAWVLIKSSGPAGRRGVGGFAGGTNARQRMFMDLRRKWAGIEEPAREEQAARPSDPNATRYEGSATGGPLPGDGIPVTLEVNLTDPDKVSGTFSFSSFRTGPLKDPVYNKDTGELKFKWDGNRGETEYTFKIAGDSLTGTTPLPEGQAITVNAKKVSAQAAAEEAKPKGPSIEERVLMANPAGFISASTDERVRTSALTNWRRLTMDTLPQDVEVMVRQSDYDYMNSRLADGVPVMAEFDLKHTFVEGPIPLYNTLAEIPGTEKPEEVVIISAHMDSWDGPGSQGCTDNGTGSAVTLEAARILMAAGARPKRTIRFVLWTGEEQGLLGSRAYVESLAPEERALISAVFVDDGGTNYQGGLNALESMVPYLAAATAPVNGVFYSETDGKHLDVNIRKQERFRQEGASDNASFNRVGIPGFFWDETGRADYFFGWHTQNDKYTLAIPEYLMQSATNSAVAAYNLACAPDLLPRAPAAAPRQEGGGESQRRRPDEPPGRQGGSGGE